MVSCSMQVGGAQGAKHLIWGATKPPKEEGPVKPGFFYFLAKKLLKRHPNQ